MKKQILSVLTMLSLVAAVIAAVTVTPAAAQAFHIIKVDVPFCFSSGAGEFPAGKYTIEPVNEGGTVILIRSENGKAIGTLMGSSAQVLSPKNETSVVFHRYGDHYFLSQVWTVGTTTGIEIAKSSMERRFQRAAIQARNGESTGASGPAIVTIAALPTAR